MTPQEKEIARGSVLLARSAALVASTLLATCSSKPVAPFVAAPSFPVPAQVLEQPLPIAIPATSPTYPNVRPTVVRGSGRFVGDPTPSVGAPGLAGDAVTLDFANADVRDVVRAVLGDLLRVPFTIDPGAQGTVTLQSAGPIQRNRVLPELEAALRLDGLAVVDSGGLYKVVPIGQASREVSLSNGNGVGFVARIVTPRYVSAVDLDKLLEPLVPNGTTLRSESSRNILIVSGPAQDVNALLSNLAIFDVDTMRGMSTALLPLKSAQAKDVAKDVTALLTGLGENGQIVRVAPLERLNALLVTSMQPDYIDRVRHWVEGLDKANPSSDRQLFVYNIQNGRAADLAEVLRKALGLAGDEGGPMQHAGLTSGNVAHGGGGAGASVASASPQQSSDQGPVQPNPLLGQIPAIGSGASSSQPFSGFGRSGDDGQPGPEKSYIRITADETNNALLILATQKEYATIESALRRLDIPPLEVMVETTIAEVTLTNQLAFGLQYYVKSGNLQALFAQPAAGSTSSPFSGFNFAQGLNLAAGTSASGSTVILQMLQQLTNVRVLSSPNVLVSNNQAARIEVGDQVPIATGSAVSTITSNAPIVNSIEYRDTGIILNITPRVNASGQVSLDVGEEVSNVSTTTSSSLNSPTISERRLDTSVVVRDGQTVAIGGLISDSRTRSNNGIPVLQSLPGVGWLFGQKSDQINRTELIAILTPRVIRTPVDMQLITDELQRKLPLTLPVRFGAP